MRLQVLYTQILTFIDHVQARKKGGSEEQASRQRGGFDYAMLSFCWSAHSCIFAER
jgi:hypothetical protein